MDISKIAVLEKMIADAERRIGAYVASQPELYNYSSYITKQSAKIQAWTQQIDELLKSEEARDDE
jgi:hypothetical protein